ncbi:hypothetical protein JXR93_09040 [bacterium]|nr:hypothetical protein [bacterium]
MRNLLILFSILLGTVYIFGDSVLILKSKSLSTYDSLVIGFSIDNKSKTTVISLDDIGVSDDSVLERIKNEFSLVFAIGDQALKVASSQKEKPVIFSMVLNPDRYAIDPTQITGIRMNLSIKTQLGVISALFSPIKNIGVVSSGDDTESQIKESQQIATLFGLNLVPIKVDNPSNLLKALEESSSKVEIIWMFPDRTILNPQGFNTLNQFVVQNKKPLYVLSSGLVEKGGLFSLSPDYLSVGKQAARISEKIIYSKVPVKFIPISDPDIFHLTFNYSVAKKINIINEFAVKLLNFAASKGFTINAVK